MDEDFFLPDFSLEDIDFNFNCCNEIDLSSDETDIGAQIPRSSSYFDHQMNLECFRENSKPMMKQVKKINNKPQLISFDFSSEEEINRFVGHGTKRKGYSSGTRSPILAKEHVLAERKRREKLSEKFIALSALLPGLKKADKITVLDDAISRMKQLQEQVKKLKEEKEATKEMESMILVKKSKVYIDDEPNFLSSPSENEQFDQSTLPEIEAKVVQNEVLIRIHCEKSKGCMINILNVIENLRLNVANSISLPFGDSILDITILAQMEQDFSVTILKDLVRNLRLAMV